MQDHPRAAARSYRIGFPTLIRSRNVLATSGHIKPICTKRQQRVTAPSATISLLRGNRFLFMMRLARFDGASAETYTVAAFRVDRRPAQRRSDHQRGPVLPAHLGNQRAGPVMADVRIDVELSGSERQAHPGTHVPAGRNKHLCRTSRSALCGSSGACTQRGADADAEAGQPRRQPGRGFCQGRPNRPNRTRKRHCRAERLHNLAPVCKPLLR